MNRSPLSRANLERALSIRDLSDPAQGAHALQLLVDRLVDALARAWPEARLVRSPGARVVPIADNYDRLGYAADAVARDARYTRYVDEARMLRSHTSALIPPLLRTLREPADVVYVCPGLVYRRDVIDRLHAGEPHQLDLWRLSSSQRLSSAELQVLIDTAVRACLPGPVAASQLRTSPALHPYTTEGRQIDVRLTPDAPWIEIGECGLAHPHVLERAGLDPRRWSGLAMGLGLDRLLMLHKGIPDIRLLRSTDPRIEQQMLDLTPYRSVSDQPATTRDLSVVVADDSDAEALGDALREALGPDAELIEEVRIQSETPYAGLPRSARDRLQLRSDQKNVVVRLVLRHMSRALTHEEGNRLRDRSYAAIHRGPVSEWASRALAEPQPSATPSTRAAAGPDRTGR